MRYLVLLVWSLCFVSGCGSSGSVEVQTSEYAVLRISTAGTLPAGTNLSGIGVTLEIPDNVSVPLIDSEVDMSIFTVSGVMANKTMAGSALYTPVSAPLSKATLDFVIASMEANGVGVGEFITVILPFNGAKPAASDFRVLDIKPVDISLKFVSGLGSALDLSYR